MKATYKKYVLDFKRPSGTSRGVLTQKETWYLILRHNGRYGIGECGILRGLSIDDVPEYEETLKWVCEHVHEGMDTLWEALKAFPSIQFGLEQAFLSLGSKSPFELFPSDFTEGRRAIAINGLIWMGGEKFMQAQIQQKLSEGFGCIKMKIGAIDFDREIGLLKSVRDRFPKEQIELRVDANGAFDTTDALEKLRILSTLDLHSIEQPIRAGQVSEMRALCTKTPLPIALDEELIGVVDREAKERLLREIKPHYIILKPSLIGGYRGSREWIDLACRMDIGWWVTSALESNIGLNAIAQWSFTLGNPLPQGLGTGSLFTNNIESPLKVSKGTLSYDPSGTAWPSDVIEELCT